MAKDILPLLNANICKTLATLSKQPYWVSKFSEYDSPSILSYNHHQKVHLHPSVFLSDQRTLLYTDKQHIILGLGFTCGNVAYS
jgi:hypothetical protein